MKIIVLLSFFLLSIGIANAQKTRFGLKGGLNIANIDLTTNSTAPFTFNSKTSFNVGFIVEINVSPKLYIQPEVFYSGQGASFNFNVSNGSQQVFTYNKLNFGYINIPVIVKYDVAQNIFLEFGPQIGFLVNADLETTFNNQTKSQSFSQNVRDYDFGLNIGLGFNATKDLSINGRYYFGLTNIDKSEPNTTSDQLKNRVLSIDLIYKFKS